MPTEAGDEEPVDHVPRTKKRLVVLGFTRPCDFTGDSSLQLLEPQLWTVPSSRMSALNSDKGHLAEVLA